VSGWAEPTARSADILVGEFWGLSSPQLRTIPIRDLVAIHSAFAVDFKPLAWLSLGHVLEAFMRYLFIFLLAGVVGAGCQSNLAKAPTARGVVAPFPEIPPAAEADPSNRHFVTAWVPTVMEVERGDDSLAVSFPSLQPTNLTVGYKMTVGIRQEESIYHDGAEKPINMGLQSGLAFAAGTNVLAVPTVEYSQPGQNFDFEHRITIFETDLPAQHMWSPESGKYYKVLWTGTFREPIR
jgi:hypothetical protein